MRPRTCIASGDFANMKAVILAAGCATRLRPHSDDRPKTLLPVGGVPILRRTITSLLRCGFDQFVIGTGYLEHMVRQAVEAWFPTLDVTYVSNKDFRSTNNAYSLLLCRPHVENDSFILLDGDVVFDLGVVEELVERGPDCLAVRSVGEIGLEEVKVTADVEDRVLAIGKHVPVRSAMGESVGIELFSAVMSRRLLGAMRHGMHGIEMVKENIEEAVKHVVGQGTELFHVDVSTSE